MLVSVVVETEFMDELQKIRTSGHYRVSLCWFVMSEMMICVLSTVCAERNEDWKDAVLVRLLNSDHVGFVGDLKRRHNPKDSPAGKLRWHADCLRWFCKVAHEVSTSKRVFLN